MKKILVPVDFSQQSNEAYTVALDWAQSTKGEIVLVHVLVPPGPYVGLAGETIAYDMTYFTQMEADIKKALQKMKERAGSVPVTTDIVYGDLVSGISNVIEKKEIDFIIIGTSGASGLTETFIGSNTEKVVRFSTVPVLAVRKSIAIKSIKNILLPSTLNLNQTDFIQKLKSLQKLLHATLHILLINTPLHFRRDAEANEALGDFVRHYGLTNYKLYFRSYTHEQEGILNFASVEKMDLVAMATHARKGLAHLFNGSITENVVNHTDAPIWTYRLKDHV
ncbi:universal stress protein [Ohtaekwangia koreensis]|uniref:Nucleotide-binding universal stress protein, UspA family n=1 Tax=Ohtaekwangia koreensis TaxID=688867 RepID=A0A1T5M5J0_9BACT|nr:universal stress protein [Ohtaekwangia koreensis]SKC83480.1 Nucleotide-binding universal stress protein, UspA family [Ohtaekwangia koreensis]